MSAKIIFEDVSDAQKSTAQVLIAGNPISVPYWYSMKKAVGENFDAFIMASAQLSIGNHKEFIKILRPLAEGEDTTFYRLEEDADGQMTTVFGGEDTRNWARKWMDEVGIE
jgi:hypothetical protein